MRNMPHAPARRDSAVTVKRRPSRALVDAIHAAALAEVFDAREWMPGVEEDRQRVNVLAAEAQKTDTCLRELERICDRVGLEHARVRLQERVSDLRALLLNPATGWLVVDQRETRAAHRPHARLRRYSRVLALVTQAHAEGFSRTAALGQIGYQWSRDFWTMRHTLNPDARRRLLGSGTCVTDPTQSDRFAILISEQLRKLLERPPRDKTPKP